MEPVASPAPGKESAAPGEKWPADAKPALIVQRGVKPGAEYPIYEGTNFIGRTDEEPVDINLEDQESGEQVWSSRQHAVIIFENGFMTIEDLKSANFTYLNRARLAANVKTPIKPGDVIQIGAIHLKLRA
jgi:pSer/pThr/pTyr-binding forkhead associated (FHA) protein